MSDKLMFERALEILSGHYQDFKNDPKSSDLSKQILSSDIQPFVYLEPLGDIEGSWNSFASLEPLALPFRTCAFSFETEGALPIFSVSMKENQGAPTVSLLIRSVIIHEVEPGIYITFTLADQCDQHCGFRSNDRAHAEKYHRPTAMFGMPLSEEKFALNSTSSQIKALIENICLPRLSGDMAMETFKRKFKVRMDGEKQTHKINRVIYIRKRSDGERGPLSNEPKNIQWSHAWLVRGHWRKVEGIGKDREGNYKMNGYTWVVPHRKGDPDSPVVKKLRVIQ